MSPGTAQLRMLITPDKPNGHGMCRGGLIFTLADTAFTYACNSYNQLVVAQHCGVSFMASGMPGAILKAQAREVQHAGKSGIYGIEIRNCSGAVSTQFRGHSRTIKDRYFKET